MRIRKIIIFVLLVATTLLLSSCIINLPDNSEQEATTQQDAEEDTEVPTATPLVIVITPKGQVVMSDRIENQEGGYYIPIPESWFGKVSYQLDGAHTYIYHITQNQDEMEINPVILHVDSAKNISTDTSGINVFMQMSDTSFYEVLRMDAPYSQGSQDDVQFQTLYNDIPMMLQSAWVIDESQWQMITMPPVLSIGTPFTQDDAYIGSLYIDIATTADTLATISETPSNIETITWGATGEVEEKYTFSFGTISFMDGILTTVNIDGTAVTGPRGFGVGDHIDDVIASFTSTIELDTANVKIYYRENTGFWDELTCVPAAAAIYKTWGPNGTPIFTVSCFDRSENLSGLTDEQLLDMYTYTPFYYCTFYYGSNGIITGIRMSYRASAE